MKMVWLNLLKFIHGYIEMHRQAVATLETRLPDEQYPITMAGFRAARRAWLNTEPDVTWCDGKTVVECNMVRALPRHWSEGA